MFTINIKKIVIGNRNQYYYNCITIRRLSLWLNRNRTSDLQCMYEIRKFNSIIVNLIIVYSYYAHKWLRRFIANT